MTQEALKLALDALERYGNRHRATYLLDGAWDAEITLGDKAIAAIKEALAQEQEPVAWLITDEKINSLQVDSIQRLIDRLKHAHHTDLCVRINGQDEWFQADWLKHLTRTTPPQRTWVGLTVNEIARINADYPLPQGFAQAIEAKLKDKNN